MDKAGENWEVARFGHMRRPLGEVRFVFRCFGSGHYFQLCRPLPGLSYRDPLGERLCSGTLDQIGLPLARYQCRTDTLMAAFDQWES